MNLTRSEAFEIIRKAMDEGNLNDCRFLQMKYPTIPIEENCEKFLQLADLTQEIGGDIAFLIDYSRANINSNIAIDLSRVSPGVRPLFRRFLNTLYELINDLMDVTSSPEEEKISPRDISMLDLPKELLNMVKKYDYYISGLFKTLHYDTVIKSIYGYLDDELLIVFPNNESVINNVQSGISRFLTVSSEEDITKVKIIDQKIILGFSNGKIEVYDGNTLLFTTYDEEDPIGDIIKVNNDIVASSSVNGVINIWDINNGKLLITLKGRNINIITSMKVGDTQYIASAGFSTFFQVWDISKEEPIFTSIEEKEIEALYTYDNKIVTLSMNGIVEVWDPRVNYYTSRSRLIEYEEGENPDTVIDSALSKNKLIISTSTGDIIIYNLGKHFIEKTLSSSEEIIDYDTSEFISLLPNNQLISGSFNRSINIWDLETYELKQKFYVPSIKNIIVLSKTVIVQTTGNTLRIFK